MDRANGRDGGLANGHGWGRLGRMGRLASSGDGGYGRFLSAVGADAQTCGE